MTKKEYSQLSKFTTCFYNNKECRVLEPNVDGLVTVWMFHHCQEELVPYGHLKVKYNEYNYPAHDCSISMWHYYIVVDGMILTKRAHKDRKTGVWGDRFGTTDTKFIPGCTGVGYLYGSLGGAEGDAKNYRRAKVKKHWVKLISLI